MTKPIVFNYQDHERVLEENRKLKEDIANLQIRCRIAESELVANDRHCEDCKHMKNGECSRWDCEYEPKDIVEVVRCKDCKHGHKQIEHEGELFYQCDYSECEEWFTENFFCANGERESK